MKIMHDTLQAWCHKHLGPGDSRSLHVYRLGTDGRYSTDDDFVASYDRCIDRDVLAIDHGADAYVVTIADESDAVVIDDVRVVVTNSHVEQAKARHPERVLARQLDDEAWKHAACLSIAEGVPDWNEPTPIDSLAMIKVRALRQKYEENLSSLKAMQATLIPAMEAEAYARGLRAAAGFLNHSNVPAECIEAINHAADVATPVDSADPTVAQLEDLIGAVHDVLWDGNHRGENIEEMARRVKSERDELRKQNKQMIERFLQTDPSIEASESARKHLEQALNVIATETTEYAIWRQCMLALSPDATSYPIPKRLMKTQSEPQPVAPKPIETVSHQQMIERLKRWVR